MFKKFMKWWHRGRDRQLEQDRVARILSDLMNEVTDLKQHKQHVESELDMANGQLEVKRQQDEADEKRRNGKDPWVEIKSAEFNDVKGIQIELDWNEAFVFYLRENGIVARDDDAVVQKWLLMLYKDLIERLNDQVIDNSDGHFTNEFE